MQGTSVFNLAELFAVHVFSLLTLFALCKEVTNPEGVHRREKKNAPRELDPRDSILGNLGGLHKDILTFSKTFLSVDALSLSQLLEHLQIQWPDPGMGQCLTIYQVTNFILETGVLE